MPHMTRRLFIVLSFACVALLLAAPRADLRASRDDVDAFKQKMAAILALEAHPAQQPRRTTVTENELNAYLASGAASQLPVGVADPSVSILGPGRILGRAAVDLDSVRKQKNPTSPLDPMTFLAGRVQVTAVGTLTTGNGKGRFALESASVAGVPIPTSLLREVVAFYSRTPENPAGISLDAPFSLPAGIREIQIDRGQAIVVQ
jgi:hypothetical protein